MHIQVDKLKRHPQEVEVNEETSAFPVLSEVAGNGLVEFDSCITGLLRAVLAGDAIEVSGNLAADVTVPCSRCLAQVSRPLDVAIQLCFSSKMQDEDLAVEELEIKSDELGLIAYNGQDIDLRPHIEQEIVMTLPQQTVCVETCKGMCPSCGMNLNTATCTCEKPVFHPGLASLKNLKIES